MAISDIAYSLMQRRVSLSGATWRWLVIAALVIVELSWAARLGVPADLSTKRIEVIIVTLLAAISFTFRRLNFQIIGDVFETFAQVLFLVLLGNSLSCLVIASARNIPLADGMLARLDSAMGFKWVAWHNFFQGLQTFNSLLSWVYYSLGKEYALVLLYLAVMQKRDKCERLLWASMLSLLLVIAISAGIPAIGAGYFYGFSQPRWTADILGLRAHTADILKAFGSISFPSFHTVLALLLIDAVRHNKWLLMPSLAFNGLMILAMPTLGSHYFIDIIGGAVVAVFILWVIPCEYDR